MLGLLLEKALLRGGLSLDRGRSHDDATSNGSASTSQRRVQPEISTRFRRADSRAAPRRSTGRGAIPRADDQGRARNSTWVFNGKIGGPDRQTGFVLLVFPYGDDGQGRCNFASNGADRRDVVTLMREMIMRFEGQPEMCGARVMSSAGTCCRRIRLRRLRSAYHHAPGRLIKIYRRALRHMLFAAGLVPGAGTEADLGARRRLAAAAAQAGAGPRQSGSVALRGPGLPQSKCADPDQRLQGRVSRALRRPPPPRGRALPARPAQPNPMREG